MIKSEIRNPKSETSTNTENRSLKRYDLEDRTLRFAKGVRLFIKTLSRNTAAIEDSRQLVRSSGSIGAILRSTES